ncbi:MAG: TM0106 family RecB-like putative nuclease [Spirochaetota bacterium]
MFSASTLYNYLQCPHRPWRDLYGPQAEKSTEDNPFVQLLWERGVLHEENVIKTLGTFADLRGGTYEERFARTAEEMKKGAPLIYQGVLMHGELLGIPDLLQRQPGGEYLPVDIKSGSGLEGENEDTGEEGRPKKHYAVQLALYSEALQGLGFSTKRAGRIIDINLQTVNYDLNDSFGPRTPGNMWSYYQDTKAQLAPLLKNETQNKPALSGTCKMCVWYESCKKWCKEKDDLTTLFSLGFNRREKLNAGIGITTAKQMRGINIPELAQRKKKDKGFLPGIGESTLENYKARAEVMHDLKKPRLYRAITLPDAPIELFFDIEDDPTQDYVYLHGVYERKEGKGTFYPFWAKTNTREDEKKAWAEFWGYVRSLPPGGYSVYYYSSHEKTNYKRLFKRYPDVVTQEELDAFFASANTVDLYTDIILKHTDWPLSSYSVKDIATYLGFMWRDKTPSGALSIKWYNDYLASGDSKMMQRILDYNEDDCKAMMVIKDALVKLKVE